MLLDDVSTQPREIPRDVEIELTILMPCLNEALTVKTCVEKAQAYLKSRSISGEVLVADNGSTDGSQRIARASAARVVPISQQGYGAALIGGIAAARGRFVIMGDADDSYDFADLDPFLDALRSGVELVVGNRFHGGIRPGRDAAAQPLPRQSCTDLHRAAAFCFAGRRFPLWIARFRATSDSRFGTSSRGHGIRQRDGDQSLSSQPPHRRSPDDR